MGQGRGLRERQRSHHEGPGNGGGRTKCGATTWIDAGRGVSGECRTDEGIAA